MKKQILSLALLACSAFVSCHTSSSSSTSVTPATPTSTFNITVNGHSYHLSGNSYSNPILSLQAQTLATSNYAVQITWNDGAHKTSGSINAYKADMSSAIGTYTNDSMSLAQVGVFDYGDGGKFYSNAGPGTSTVTITTSNSSEVKGTFNLNLTYSGAQYNITGDFDYKH